jgi:negative modulator of initiation of replication
MRAIELDDDVYFYLLGRTADGKLSFSDLLRNTFGIGAEAPVGEVRTRLHRRGRFAVTEMTPPADLRPPSAVEQWLKSPRFLGETTSLGRFMCLLSFLAEKHGDAFECVLDLSGRKRRYFARSAEELDQWGQSVFPKQVPRSPYWVVTNTETAKKRQIVESVMRMLGYNGSDVRIASSAI